MNEAIKNNNSSSAEKKETSDKKEKMFYALKHLGSGKVYDYFADSDWKLSEIYIVNTGKGQIACKIVAGPYTIEKPQLPDKEWKIIRQANQKDLDSFERSRVRERDAFQICRQKIESLKLPMNLIRCEMTLGGGRAIFYFSSEGRVDFRQLLKIMSQELRSRIELVQIGVRDETKCLGGIGICGREFCCTSHLREFAPVSIKMAKEQNLPLNPQKVSGGCGRLLCCLAYEFPTYRFLNKEMPKVGKKVDTPRGIGRVRYIDVFRQKIIVQYEDGLQEAHQKEEVKRINAPQQQGNKSRQQQSPRSRRNRRQRSQQKKEEAKKD